MKAQVPEALLIRAATQRAARAAARAQATRLTSTQAEEAEAEANSIRLYKERPAQVGRVP